MTTYNTGNPLGSGSDLDFYDNKQFEDQRVNSQAATVTDRFGRTRKTVAGIDQSLSGYTPQGAWATATNYVVNDLWEDGGTWYLVLSDYTSGATAAADIASGNVTVHQPKNWIADATLVLSVVSVAEMNALDTGILPDRQQIRVEGGNSFYLDKTAGEFRYAGSQAVFDSVSDLIADSALIDSGIRCVVIDNGEYLKTPAGFRNLYKTKDQPQVFDFQYDGFGWLPNASGSLTTHQVSLSKSGYSITSEPWNIPYISSATHERVYLGVGGGNGSSSASTIGIAGWQTVFDDVNTREIVFTPGNYFISATDWDGTMASSQTAFSVENNGIAKLIWGTDSFTWADEGDGIYSTSDTDYDDVINVVVHTARDEFGHEYPLQKLSSLAELTAASEGFFLDAGTLYVKPVAGRPIGDAWCLFGTGGIDQTTGSRYSFKNISFYGGGRVVQSQNTDGVWYFDNCEFKFGGSSGYRMIGTNIYTYLKNCVAYCNYGDGLTYSGTSCHVVEDNCQSYKNGFNNSDQSIQNGSSLHGTCRAIRVGGTYGSTYGPVVADVQDSKSWNIGCAAFNSRTTSGVSSSWEAWGPDSSYTGAEMWIVNCTGYGSDYDLYAHSGGIIHYRNFESDLKFFEDVDGTIEEY